MRSFIVGILTLCLSAATALGQARGHVESVGFGGAFRPTCWTPMVVYLVPTTGSPFSGRLEVVQEDLDKDKVIFTRQFSLTGNAPDGSTREQRFWMYFVPQPAPDLDENRTVAELTEMIKVRVVSDKGKELVKLPITQKLEPIESVRRGMSGSTKGRKFVLFVAERSAPQFIEYPSMTGLNEDVLLPWGINQIATGLPDRVIGYDGVDAIIWMDADPLKLSVEQYKALQDYVARGGRLVISQDTSTNQWQRNNAALAQLMPVVVEGVAEQDEPLALRRLARVPDRPRDTMERARADEWQRLSGPFPYAVGNLKPGAFMLEANDGTSHPFMVRKPYGAGSVTWIAQDLGNRNVLGRGERSTSGWVHIWDRAFDWPNDPISGKSQSREAELYKPHVSYELGKSTLKYMDLPSTSAALISIAVLFFIVYWVAAGPGSYLVLSKKGKATMSWFAFAALAIAATGLTWVIVKLVLRGDAQLQHVSYVRMAPNVPAIVHSNFGLYIPRDGDQKIELKNAAEGAASYVTAFNLHPAFNDDANEFPAKQEYRVPVMEVQVEGADEKMDPKVVNVPYRSTLKKFQSQWSGNLDKGITVTDPIVLAYETANAISGRLRNDTGRDLRNVYIVVNHPGDRREPDPRDHQPSWDYVLFAHQWAQGAEIDTAQMRIGQRIGAAQVMEGRVGPYHSSAKDTPLIKGIIGAERPGLYGFAQYWYDNGFRAESWGDREWSEDEPLNPRTFPILSFFDRIPPAKNRPGGGQRTQPDRVDLIRRGLRHLDMSAAISAGQMAVIAVADDKNHPLPFPLEVHGDPVKGQGIVYYQFVIPVDRKAVADAAKTASPEPATKPSTKPGTKPSTKPTQAAVRRSDPILQP
jgi:hypothetical protein